MPSKINDQSRRYAGDPPRNKNAQSRRYRALVEKVVASGEWLYDGTAPMLVSVVQLDYDYWYAVAEADGDLGPHEQPALNDRGYLYYVRYKPGWSEDQPFWPDSPGYPTVAEAQAAAEGAVPAAITWR